MIQVLPAGGNFASNFGAGIGRGLSEQVPKEVERSRLAYGLKNLNETSEGLTPFERFSKLLAIPGLTPQGVQSAAELLKMEGQRRGLSKRAQTGAPPSAREVESQGNIQPGQANTQAGAGMQGTQSSQGAGFYGNQQGEGQDATGSREALENTYLNYLPKDREQIFSRANELMDLYPEYYQGDSNEAVNDALQEDQNNKLRSESLQNRRKLQTEVQEGLRGRLQDQRLKRNAIELPEKTYQKIEDKALNSILPKNKGGAGKTELQAEKEFGEEIEKASRQYSQIKSLPRKALVYSDKKEVKNNIDSLSKEFMERDDSKNFADKLISEVALSPENAYALAYPIYTTAPEIGKKINSLPEASKTVSPFGQQKTSSEFPDLPQGDFDDIVGLLNNKTSLLAISKGIRDKGYNHQNFMRKMKDRRDKLTPEQQDELGQVLSFRPTLNDLMLGLVEDEKPKEEPKPIRVKVNVMNKEEREKSGF